MPQFLHYTPEDFQRVFQNKEVDEFYGSDFARVSFLMKTLRKHFKKANSRKITNPLTARWVHFRWNQILNDDMAQAFVNLCLWGVCPFPFMSTDTIEEAGVDEKGEYIRTLVVDCEVRPGVVKKLKYVPSSRKEHIVYSLYYNDQNYGIGYDKLFSRVTDKFFGVTSRDVRQAIRKTTEWQLHCRLGGGGNEGNFVNHPNYTGHPNKKVQLDTIFLPKEFAGYTCCVTMIDVFSKKAWAWPLVGKGHSVEAKKVWEKAGPVLEALAMKAKAQGNALVVQTDAGSEFKAEFEDGIKLDLQQGKQLPIFKAHSLSFSSHRTGCIEAFNKIIKAYIYKGFTMQGKNGKGFWSKHVDSYVEGYNNTAHGTTGYTPNELQDAYQEEDPKRTSAAERIKKRNQKWLDQSLAREKSARTPDIEVGDFVRRRMTKRVSKELATESDMKDSQFSKDFAIGIQFKRHSFAMHWTRQVYKVISIVHTKTPQTKRVRMMLVPPYVMRKTAESGIITEYTSNLLRVFERNYSKLLYQPTLPPFKDAPKEARLHMPGPDPNPIFKNQQQLWQMANTGVVTQGDMNKLVRKQDRKYNPREKREPPKVVSRYGLRGRKINEPEPDEDQDNEDVIFSDGEDRMSEEEEPQPPQPSRSPSPEPPELSSEDDLDALEREHQAAREGPAPRIRITHEMPGWVMEDAGAGGNCFYHAAAKAMNYIHFQDRTDWDHAELRRRSDPDSRSGEWAEVEQIMKFVKTYPIIVAVVIMDDRPNANPMYQYFYYQDNKHFNPSDSTQTPKDMPIIRLGFTGDHYKTVISEPKEKSPKRSLLAEGQPPLPSVDNLPYPPKREAWSARRKKYEGSTQKEINDSMRDRQSSRRLLNRLDKEYPITPEIAARLEERKRSEEAEQRRQELLRNRRPRARVPWAQRRLR